MQFNPETLKLSYSIQTSPSGSDGTSNTTPKQIISGNTTKLSMQLWFDASAQSDGKQAVDDVRLKTKDVIYFVTAKKNDQGTLFVPEVQISWGSFLFQGVVESLEESLEFFSTRGQAVTCQHFVGPVIAEATRAHTTKCGRAWREHTRHESACPGFGGRFFTRACSQRRAGRKLAGYCCR